MTAATAWSGEWHPLAERFPMLDEAALRELAASIKEVGQLDACKMAPDGTGLDGRNRIAACKIAGVEPAWTVTKADPVGVIIAQNVRHRHMKPSAQAMAVAIGMEKKGLRANGRWKRGSVPAPLVEDDNGKSPVRWSEMIQRCGVILDWRPDLADGVLRGDPLDAAYQKATTARDQEITAVDREAEIKALPADLAALVESGHRSLEDAKEETGHRKAVSRADTVRSADELPTFVSRVHADGISWSEAAMLSERWLRERGESFSRDQERVRRINSAWGAVETIQARPDSQYVRELINSLGQADQEALRKLLAQIGA